jgi:1-deoxy-D-xylulose-5-phosphate reductoisomerase
VTGKRIAILGSTGSIGRQTLQVISEQAGLSVCALAAGSSWELLAAQAQAHRPAAVALACEQSASRVNGRLPEGTDLLTGPEAMTELVCRAEADVVLSGVVGMAGLRPTLAAIESGATLALANKETLVMAGAVVMPAARARGVDVLPVDSEHSAIFQCLACGRRDEVRRVTITSSGGALRDWDDQAAAQATVDDALNHPNWSMGPKITVDSATLMNKALEIVEAHWLFDLPSGQIDVVIHPESIIHSLVEFCDGSTIAQLGRPDMTVPIAYALTYPRRPQRQPEPLNLQALGSMTFRELPSRARRAVDLGFEVIERGGTTGAVLNGANEAAVEAFLGRKISFGTIVPLVEEIVNRAPDAKELSVDALMAADAWARDQVAKALPEGPGVAQSPGRS